MLTIKAEDFDSVTITHQAPTVEFEQDDNTEKVLKIRMLYQCIETCTVKMTQDGDTPCW